MQHHVAVSTAAPQAPMPGNVSSSPTEDQLCELETLFAELTQLFVTKAHRAERTEKERAASQATVQQLRGEVAALEESHASLRERVIQLGQSLEDSARLEKVNKDLQRRVSELEAACEGFRRENGAARERLRAAAIESAQNRMQQKQSAEELASTQAELRQAREKLAKEQAEAQRHKKLRRSAQMQAEALQEDKARLEERCVAMFKKLRKQQLSEAIIVKGDSSNDTNNHSQSQPRKKGGKSERLRTNGSKARQQSSNARSEAPVTLEDVFAFTGL